jgi:hypothetical protein
MLVACRLAGLSALESYYGGVRGGATRHRAGWRWQPHTISSPNTLSWRLLSHTRLGQAFLCCFPCASQMIFPGSSLSFKLLI